MDRKNSRIYVIVLILGLLFFTGTETIHAAIPNSLFSNHMVLQQKIKIPIWGAGRNGESVQVEFNNQIVNTIVENNRWEIVMEPMNAGGPYSMRITSDTVISICDIYVGEVWVCSGQSNMGRRMSPHWKYRTITNFEKEKEDANYPLIRQYEVPDIKSDSLVDDTNGRWIVCSSSTVESFSAVAYFFARDLHNSLKVPIGLLFSSVGGTEARFWTSRSGLESNSKLLPLVQAYDSVLKNYSLELAHYNANKDLLQLQYESDSADAKVENRKLPSKPVPPKNPNTSRQIGCYFNGMIAPLTKYPIKGVLWYQGESDVDFASQYQILFPTLISDWRTNWNIGDFPFLYVQIAPFKKNIPELREAQFLTLEKIQNTAMIVTIDCGDENDIHPPFKQPVGYRLSLAARALAYNEKIEYSGPLYKSYEIKGTTIELAFTHVNNGFSRDGNVNGFTISGTDKIFLPAKASIKGNKVIVYSDSIQKPIAVRYGWANVPQGNLYNIEGLPASPFRTDILLDEYKVEVKCNNKVCE